MFKWFCAIVLLFAAMPALAQEGPAIGPVPSWVDDTSLNPNPVGGSAGELTVELFDQQVRFDDDGKHVFLRTRYVITSAQGLSAVGLAIVWNPGSQTAVVHDATIWRGAEKIDALVDQSFEVIRREQNAERLVLDGVLTAVLHPRGLRVGDVLEFRYTVTTRDTVLPDHAEHITSTAFPLSINRSRFRASWPTDTRIRVRGNGLIDLPSVRRSGEWSVLDLQLDDLKPLVLPTNMPARFGQVRQIELTEYPSWAAVSSAMHPLYQTASRIDPGSPLMAEVEAIRAAGGTPQQQVIAALRLVQDDIRYIALAMGEGALVPATAEETWRNRLGDCKAKTALLIAILTELGFEAVPALVSNAFGDGLDARLPMVALFDHIMVRVVVEGETYWLDGTRAGDRSLAEASSHPQVWALPVQATGAELQPLPQPALQSPLEYWILDIDASAGLEAPARINAQIVIRGQAAVEMHAATTAITEDQLDEFLTAMWVTEIPDLTAESTRVVFDPETAELRLVLAGTATLSWDSGGDLRRRLNVPGSRALIYMDTERRPGPLENVPLAMAHPQYVSNRISVVLPSQDQAFLLEGEDIDVTLAGRQVVRTASLVDGKVTVELSVRSSASEMPLEQARIDEAPLTELRQNRVRVVAPRGYRSTDADLSAQAAIVPETADDYVYQGLVYQGADELPEAIAAYDKALELDPDNANAYANRGLAHLSAGNEDQGRADIARARDLDPSEVVAMNGQGLIYMIDGDYEDAVIEFSRSIRYSTDDAWPLFQRGRAHAALDAYDKALADFDAVLAIVPENGEVMAHRIEVLARMGREADAVVAMEQLLATDPGNEGLLQALAQLQLLAGQNEAAVRTLDGALALFPDSSELLSLRGVSYFRTGAVDAAAGDIDRSLALAAGDADLLNNICWRMALENYRLDQALATCDAALALDPQEPSIIDSRAMVLLRLGRSEEALAEYERALALEPELIPALYGRGMARTALGQEAAGAADIRRALDADPRAADDFTTVSPTPISSAEPSSNDDGG